MQTLTSDKAMQAIVALLNGEFDNQILLDIGPLFPTQSENLDLIIALWELGERYRTEEQ